MWKDKELLILVVLLLFLLMIDPALLGLSLLALFGIHMITTLLCWYALVALFITVNCILYLAGDEKQTQQVRKIWRQA